MVIYMLVNDSKKYLYSYYCSDDGFLKVTKPEVVRRQEDGEEVVTISESNFIEIVKKDPAFKYGLIIRKLRTKEGVTIEELARRVGKSPDRVSRIENGRINFRIDIYVAIL